MANAQTRATERYQEKAGTIAKTYKLKEADADAFKAACEANGESQAAVLTRLMAGYVAGNKKSRPGLFWRFFGFLRALR
jgi:hypothetical protein